MKLLSLRAFAALLALCALPLLAACPADEDEPVTPADAGQVAFDAGEQADAGTPTDAGEPADAGTPVEPGPGELGGVCAAGNTCATGTCTTLPEAYGSRCTQTCLENAECPENLRCEATSEIDMYCLFGPRGTGGIGDPCGEGKGLGCASGICLNADPQEAIAVDTCTASCTADSGCVVPFPVCHPHVGLCLPIGSGETGGICRYDGSCFEDTGSTCMDLEGIGQRCAKECLNASDCGADYLECQDFSGTKYCVLKSNG